MLGVLVVVPGLPFRGDAYGLHEVTRLCFTRPEILGYRVAILSASTRECLHCMAEVSEWKGLVREEETS